MYGLREVRLYPLLGKIASPFLRSSFHSASKQRGNEEKKNLVFRTEDTTPPQKKIATDCIKIHVAMTQPS